jgi:hypothetical protein
MSETAVNILEAETKTKTETEIETISPKGPVLERRSITFKNQKRVLCKQDQVVLWLQEFYSMPGNLEKLLNILQGKSAISLRLVDYFVTNYAKKMNTSFTSQNRHFLVYFNYKRELNAYSKRLFDPFCRRERIQFEARGEPPFVTTVGQLNFFRWFIEKNIYDYVLENHAAIEKDMNSTLKEHYSRSNSTLSTVGTSSCAKGGSESLTNSVSSAGAGSATTTETEISTGPLAPKDGSVSETAESVAPGSASATKSSRKKRCELTTSAMKKVNIHECEVIVSFS